MRTLVELAALGDALARESSKLAKASRLAEALRASAASGTLRLVVRLLAGRVFGVTEGRVLGVSSAAVRDAVLSATGLAAGAWRSAAIAAGETGEALASVHAAFPPPSTSPDGPMTLTQLHDELTALSEVSSATIKRECLRRLLLRASADGPRALAYVGKVITGDLRIGAAEGLLLDAIAQAFGVSPESVRRALRSLGDVADVAVLACERGDQALRDAPFALFQPVSFMLAAVAMSSAELAERVTGEAILEDKLDGIRVQVHKSGEGSSARVELFTRTLERVTASFPEVVEAVRTIRGDVLLDGELLAVRGPAAGALVGESAAGRVVAAPFAHLQQRLHRRQLDARLLAAYPVAFIAFDLLYGDGESLLDRPLRQRRALLESRLAGSAVGVLPATVVGPGVTAEAIEAAFAQSRGRRNEGLVLKLLVSPYSPGRRGGVWFKLKGHLPTLDCVVVRAEVGHGKRRGVLSDYTFAVRDTESPGGPLRVLGKAYSGLTDEEIAELTAHFREVSTGNDGRRFDVPPTVVLEIAFDAVQRSDRHDSGFALRFPRIVRWRRDKTAAEVSTLADVRQIFHCHDNLNRTELPDDRPSAENAPAGSSAFPVEPRGGRRSRSASRRERASGSGGQLSLFGDPPSE